MRKKLSLFVTAIILVVTCFGQGVLKKEYYRSFSDDQIDNLIQGGDAELDRKFNERANVDVETWRKWLDKNAIEKTGKSLQEGIQNHEYEFIPLSGEVRTTGVDFKWFFRGAYSGEYGLWHKPTGELIFSTVCLNLLNMKIAPKKTAPPAERHEYKPDTYRPDNQPTYSNYNYNNNECNCGDDYEYADYRSGGRKIRRKKHQHEEEYDDNIQRIQYSYKPNALDWGNFGLNVLNTGANLYDVRTRRLQVNRPINVNFSGTVRHYVTGTIRYPRSYGSDWQGSSGGGTGTTQPSLGEYPVGSNPFNTSYGTGGFQSGF